MLEIDASALMSGHVHTIVYKAFYDVIVQMLGIKQYLADDITLKRLIASIHFLFVNTSGSKHEILKYPKVCFYPDRSSHQRFSVRKDVLRNFTGKNSQENTCARVSFLIKFDNVFIKCF